MGKKNEIINNTMLMINSIKSDDDGKSKRFSVKP